MASPAPTLPGHVWTGWLEEFRQWVTPTTDACEESIYAAGLLALSCAIGRTVSINYAGALYSNLYVAIVGETGLARKSTMLDRVRAVLQEAFTEDWLRWAYSVGSGEGLLERFCQEHTNGNGHDGHVVLKSIPGQRLVLDEAEFTTLLVKISRPGTASLHEILMNLYDGRNYRPTTRSRPMEIIEPFFSILTATTPSMLEKRIDESHVTSGLLPRFAFFQATAREPLAYPALSSRDGLRHLAQGLQSVSQFALGLNRIVQLTPDAMRSWKPMYDLFEGERRALEDGSKELLTRIPALMLKTTLLYALMRHHEAADEEDLRDGHAVGRYCAEVATRLSMEALDIGQEGRLVERIKKVTKGADWMMASAITGAIGKIGRERLYRALDYMVKMGELEKKTVLIRGCERLMFRRIVDP